MTIITDKDRLDFLQSILKGKVICRNSERGRGMRLHQTRGLKYSIRSSESVRNAIDDYMKIYPTEKRCECKTPQTNEGFYDWCEKCKLPL